MKIQLNEYQQSLFDSKRTNFNYKFCIQLTITWLLIVGLGFELADKLPEPIFHWLTFGLILLAISNVIGLGSMIIVKFVLFGFSIALEVVENQERLQTTYNGIKSMAVTGICNITKFNLLRVFDHLTDFILFFLLISNNYLTLGTALFVMVLLQWACAFSIVNSMKLLLSKIPDPLESNGEKPDIGKLIDDLISDGGEVSD